MGEWVCSNKDKAKSRGRESGGAKESVEFWELLEGGE